MPLKGATLKAEQVPGKDYAFSLKTVKRTYLLSAPTEEEFSKWQRAIQAAIDIIGRE